MRCSDKGYVMAECPDIPKFLQRPPGSENLGWENWRSLTPKILAPDHGTAAALLTAKIERDRKRVKE
jgi:hypothetical protein